jgi:hypothetical protein
MHGKAARVSRRRSRGSRVEERQGARRAQKHVLAQPHADSHEYKQREQARQVHLLKKAALSLSH